MKHRRILRAARPFLGVIALLGAWWGLAASQLFDPVLLPSPWKALLALIDGFANQNLLYDFEVTIWRTTASLAIGCLIAIPLGIILGSNEDIYRSLEFVVDFFRSTPTSAMFPLFLVLFGVGDKTKIAVAAFGASLVILFNVAYGVMNSRKTRVLAARVMGASKVRVLFDVYAWESLPQIFVGMRNGVSVSLVIVIVAEMFIGSSDGLGRRLIDSQMSFDMPSMYATIFAAGALGYSLNWIFLSIEKKFVHWGGK
jgi:NitT/TauT family transport system permease protein